MSEKINDSLTRGNIFPFNLSITMLAEAGSFLKIWIPSMFVFVALGLGTFGLNWWLALSPGGAKVLGIVVGAANVVAVIVVVFFSGTIDRMNRKQFLMRGMGFLVVISAVLIPLLLAEPDLLIILMMAGLCYFSVESIYSVYGAATETTVADLAPTTWASSRVASLISVPPLVARLVAPLIGGILIAAGFLWFLPLLAVGMTILAIIALIKWSSVLQVIKYHTEAGEANSKRSNPLTMLRTSLQDVKEASTWIKTKPLLIFMIVIGVLGNLIVFPFYSLLPAFLTELNLGEERMALLYGQAASAYGIGLLISTMLFSRFGRKPRRPDIWVTLNMLAIVATLGVISFFPQPAVIIVCMGIIGMLFIGLVAVAGGTWLDLTPSDMRARIFSVRRLVMFASIPVGTSLMGFASAAFGFAPLLRTLLAIVVVTLLIAWVVLTRSQRRTVYVQATASD